jgi:hypothetical protein
MGAYRHETGNNVPLTRFRTGASPVPTVSHSPSLMSMVASPLASCSALAYTEATQTLSYTPTERLPLCGEKREGTMSNKRAPVEVFYSYAHEDEALRNELEKHLSLLQRLGLISSWHERIWLSLARSAKNWEGCHWRLTRLELSSRRQGVA